MRKADSGGHAGDGGSGGGGGGGPSIGVLCGDGGSYAALDTSFVIGTGGTGGTSAGISGKIGKSAETHGCTP